MTTTLPSTPVPDRVAPAVRVPPLSAPTRPRSRPSLIVLGIALAATGAVVAAWLFLRINDTVPVVAVAQPVARGEVVEAADLVVANIVDDPALDAVPGDRLDSLVGLRAAVDLPAGGLVTGGAVTDSLVPGPGESVVGLALTRAQLPVAALVAGDRVTVVATPRTGDDPPVEAPFTLDVVVLSVLAVEETGEFLVDVVVPPSVAPRLAAVAATGRLAVILETRTVE